MKKEQLESLLSRAESFIGKGLTSSDPKFTAWRNSVNRFCENEYGKDSSTTKAFKSRHYAPMVFFDNTSDDEYVKFFESDMMESIEDLKSLIDEFGLYEKETIQEKKRTSTVPNLNVNINNTNNNSNVNNNNNSINVMSIDDIRESIEENTYLSDNDKSELLSKLEEIKELQTSSDSKSKKWEIGKKLLSFVLDKGADIAIMFIPQILKAISF